jgi:hypothetical protein
MPTARAAAAMMNTKNPSKAIVFFSGVGLLFTVPMLVSGAPSSTSFLSDVISIQLLSAVIRGPTPSSTKCFSAHAFFAAQELNMHEKIWKIEKEALRENVYVAFVARRKKNDEGYACLNIRDNRP